jgi:hypothetical protein
MRHALGITIGMQLTGLRDNENVPQSSINPPMIERASIKNKKYYAYQNPELFTSCSLRNIRLLAIIMTENEHLWGTHILKSK